MNFQELRTANISRCNKWHSHRGGIKSWSLSDWAVAAAGEMGEMCNVVKKLNRARDKMAGNKANELTETQLRLMLADEIADTIIYLDILAESEGLNLEGIIVSKFNEVSIREGFPERLNYDPSHMRFTAK